MRSPPPSTTILNFCHLTNPVMWLPQNIFLSKYWYRFGSLFSALNHFVNVVVNRMLVMVPANTYFLLSYSWITLHASRSFMAVLCFSKYTQTKNLLPIPDRMTKNYIRVQTWNMQYWYRLSFNFLKDSPPPRLNIYLLPWCLYDIK